MTSMSNRRTPQALIEEAHERLDLWIQGSGIGFFVYPAVKISFRADGPDPDEIGWTVTTEVVDDANEPIDAWDSIQASGGTLMKALEAYLKAVNAADYEAMYDEWLP